MEVQGCLGGSSEKNYRDKEAGYQEVCHKSNVSFHISSFVFFSRPPTVRSADMDS